MKRLAPNGQPDLTWGNAGSVEVSSLLGDNVYGYLATQSDGRIVASLYHVDFTDSSLMRFWD